MKKTILNFTFSLILLLAGANLACAQTDKPYTDGPLWQVQFVHTKPGMTNIYLKNLSEGWVKEMRALKDAGIIMDFKILSSQPGSENDYDLILMYELKNYAALDGLKDKMDAMGKKVLDMTDDAAHTKAIARNDMRVIQGGKLTQELDFK
jgi:hypothetical protein